MLTRLANTNPLFHIKTARSGADRSRKLKLALYTLRFASPPDLRCEGPEIIGSFADRTAILPPGQSVGIWLWLTYRGKKSCRGGLRSPFLGFYRFPNASGSLRASHKAATSTSNLTSLNYQFYKVTMGFGADSCSSSDSQLSPGQTYLQPRLPTKHTGEHITEAERRTLLRLIAPHLSSTNRYSLTHEELLTIDSHYSAWYYPSDVNPLATHQIVAPLTPPATPTGNKEKERYIWLPRASLSDPKFARALEHYQEERRWKEREPFGMNSEI